jgi:NAD(P)-dependent dehydrogenase (short-subunit alcohol dehydrogenase family)
MDLDDLTRLPGRLASAVLDPTILFSFDRTGFLLHRTQFRADDLAVDLSGRVCLVTGANSGLGQATATALARLGADVWLLCRDAERGEAALAEMRRATRSRRLHLELVDLARQSSVREFARRFTEPRVDVLVHNAAVLPDARATTEDGIELALATNLIGPFLLTQLLLPRLRLAPAARVILVSSGGMYTQPLVVDELLAPRKGEFDGVAQYARTKRAEVVLAELWAERLNGTNMTVNSMHPGWADTPAVRTSLPRFHRVMRPLLRSAEEGADTIVWLAACPRIEGMTGLFWFDREPRRTHYVPWTRESAAERERLWQVCCELSGMKDQVLINADGLPERSR